MTDFGPEFLEALAQARDVPVIVAPAVLRDCAAAWRKAELLADRWRAMENLSGTPPPEAVAKLDKHAATMRGLAATVNAMQTDGGAE